MSSVLIGLSPVSPSSLAIVSLLSVWLSFTSSDRWGLDHFPQSVPTPKGAGCGPGMTGGKGCSSYDRVCLEILSVLSTYCVQLGWFWGVQEVILVDRETQ